MNFHDIIFEKQAPLGVLTAYPRQMRHDRLEAARQKPFCHFEAEVYYKKSYHRSEKSFKRLIS